MPAGNRALTALGHHHRDLCPVACVCVKSRRCLNPAAAFSCLRIRAQPGTTPRARSGLWIVGISLVYSRKPHRRHSILVIAYCACRTHSRRLTSGETTASACAPRSWGRFPFGQPAFQIRTVSEIGQRRAAEYDRVATDAIADLRHPELRRSQRSANAGAVFLYGLPLPTGRMF